ncbi:MAG: hypothetical protein R2813_11475 [Flavobacteriales bacterium]
MKKTFTIFFLLISFLTKAQAPVNLDTEVAKTDINTLPYTIDGIVVRGFDGTNPPPRLSAPTRPLFYGYGITAYFRGVDSLMFFTVEKLDAVHKSTTGEVIKTFPLSGARYTPAFKNYFVGLSNEEKARIYFENIYLKDKKGHYIKVDTEQLFCPNCME